MGVQALSEQPEQAINLEPAASLYAQCLIPGMGKADENPGDSRNDEDLLVCGVCGQPKEMWLTLKGDEDKPPLRVRVLCRCQQEKLDAEEAYAATQRRKMRNEETLGLLREIGAALPISYDFGMYDGGSEKNFGQAKYYADHFDRMLSENIGLLFYGNTGRGKTFYSEAIARSVIDKGYLAVYTRIPNLAEAMKSNDGRDRAWLLRVIERCDLLVLDDLGAERDTAWMLEQAELIIDTRYKSKRPVIVTTNLDPRDLISAEDLARKRPYERIMEMCRPVEIVGENRRTQLAARRSAAWEKILGENE